MEKETPFTIQGLVKHQDTLQGIPDLLVVALDLDPNLPNDVSSSMSQENLDQIVRYDRLGSVLTDQSGHFKLDFTERDFQVLQPEARPDLILVVLAPETAHASPSASAMFNDWSVNANIVHISPPIRVKAGRTESYSIRVPQETLERFGIRLVPAETTSDPALLGLQWQASREQLDQKINLRFDHLTALADLSTNLQDRLTPLFTNFDLSGYSPLDRAKPTYLAVGDDLTALQGEVIDAGMARLEDASSQRLTMDLPAGVARDWGLLGEDGTIVDRVRAGDIADRLQGAMGNVLERRREAFLNCYRTFTEADLDDPDVIDVPDDPDPVVDGPDTATSELVRRQLNCATCPEEPLSYSLLVDQDYKNQDLTNTISGLELRGGPTDVTSYHDFQMVNVAFESIWTEVVDDEIEGLGRELFEEIVRLDEDDLGDRLLTSLMREGLSPDSLTQLMRRYGTQSSGSARLRHLFRQLEAKLAEPYRFDVFAPDSINYGLVYTFRQQWEPGPYQVGKLVKTIPLAPKEEKSYTTKTSRKEIRALKEIEERENKGSQESQTTARAESEIIKRATHKNSFSTSASGGLDFEMFNMEFGMEAGTESEKFSSATKKSFRESVSKAAQEYKNKTKVEVQTTTEESFESTVKGKLVNPNEEISVTYLFYELQRQYEISERLHRINPVVMVAFDVPKPHEIDNDWIKTHAWILRRLLLDDSFHPALDYAEQSLVGMEVLVAEMKGALTRSQALLDQVTRELELKNQVVEEKMDFVRDVIFQQAGVDAFKDTANLIGSILDPIGSLFRGGQQGPDLEPIKEYHEAELERAEKEREALRARMRDAENNLQKITEKYGQMNKEFMDMETSLFQLRIHIKENILYYMQGIWGYEVPDQRFFRLYNLEIDWIEADGEMSASTLVPRINPDTGEVEAVEGSFSLPAAGYRRVQRKLVDVAHVDQLLGFKGNLAIFPTRKPNYLHLFMMQDYINTRTGGLSDPDAFAEFSTQDLINFLKCLRENDPSLYAQQRDRIIQLINERQQSPRQEKERIIVPSDSLYIESLPGKHPVLEDFKLVHRAIDVKKVQAEVRKMEIENARMGERILIGDLSDPDIDKHILIEGDVEGLDLDPEA